MQINIIKQQEQQMYTKTYTDNLLAVGSGWDVATKAAFAKVGQPLEFEKMKYDIAATAANLTYQLKVNKWYDRYSKAQIDSLYNQAAAAIISALNQGTTMLNRVSLSAVGRIPGAPLFSDDAKLNQMFRLIISCWSQVMNAPC